MQISMALTTTIIWHHWQLLLPNTMYHIKGILWQLPNTHGILIFYSNLQTLFFFFLWIKLFIKLEQNSCKRTNLKPPKQKNTTKSNTKQPNRRTPYCTSRKNQLPKHKTVQNQDKPQSVPTTNKKYNQYSKKLPCRKIEHPSLKLYC
jgi:hypothetical protein